jgi:AcrR family transcriptional regulator
MGVLHLLQVAARMPGHEQPDAGILVKSGLFRELVQVFDDLIDMPRTNCYVSSKTDMSVFSYQASCDPVKKNFTTALPATLRFRQNRERGEETGSMKADKRRQMLLHRAKKLFSQRGYYETQISDIIKNAKIARGTIYQYFKNKDDIFLTLLRTAYDEWQATMAEEMKRVDLANLPPTDYLKFRIRNSLTYFAKDPEFTNLVLKMGYGLPAKLVRVLDRMDKEIIDQMSAELGWAVKHGVLRKDLDVELAANLIQGAVSRIAYQYFVKKTVRNTPEEIDVLVEEIFDLIAPGMFLP